MVKIMNKKEILELRKTFRPEECNISRIATCYVTSEKEKILEKSQAFLSLPEEEAFKYFDILKQALSGTVGKNLYTLKTNSIHPADESPQKLETLRKYHMNDEGMLTDLFDSIIGSYDSSENYLIIVVNGLYDIPGVTSDDQELEDASDEVYSYILTCICPVELDEPGLSIDCTKPAILDIKRYQNGSFQTVWYLASFFNSNISVVKGDTVFLRGYRISDKSYNGFDYLDLTCSDIIGIHNL